MQIPKNRILQIFQRLPTINVAVLGDFCLDIYWTLDPDTKEDSIETGLPVQFVAQAQYSPGGAGNIVANMLAFGASEPLGVGLVGADIFGRELKSLLTKKGANTDHLIRQEADFSTYTYIKRYLNRRELERIDFGGKNWLTYESESKLLERLEQVLTHCQAVVINQQVTGSMGSPTFRKALNQLLCNTETLVLVDSRHYAQDFTQVHFKINAFELAQMFGKHIRHLSDSDTEDLAKRLNNKSQKPVFVTQGPKGIWVVEKGKLTQIPGIELKGEIDPVGAGDTVVSALALCLGVGASPVEAAYIANIAAAITVKKLYQTGTASQAEILRIIQG